MATATPYLEAERNEQLEEIRSRFGGQTTLFVQCARISGAATVRNAMKQCVAGRSGDWEQRCDGSTGIPCLCHRILGAQMSLNEKTKNNVL